MPRISQTQEIAGLGVSEALEWVDGDSATFEGLWETDDDPPQPVDLTGAAIEIVLEYVLRDGPAGCERPGEPGRRPGQHLEHRPRRDADPAYDRVHGARSGRARDPRVV